MQVPSAADDSVISKCIKCGAAITPTAKFCPKCGAAQTAPTKACPHCGMSNLTTGRFCNGCGASQTLQPQAPPLNTQQGGVTPLQFGSPAAIGGTKLRRNLDGSFSVVKPTRISRALLILGGLFAVAILIVIVRTAGRSPQQKDKDWVAANLNGHVWSTTQTSHWKSTGETFVTNLRKEVAAQMEEPCSLLIKTRFTESLNNAVVTYDCRVHLSGFQDKGTIIKMERGITDGALHDSAEPPYWGVTFKDDNISCTYTVGDPPLYPNHTTNEFDIPFSKEEDAEKVVSGFRQIVHDSCTQPEDVAILIAQEDALNDKCRDGLGDEKATLKACDERDMLYEKIKAKNWCWGHDGQVETDKAWERCESK
jgi:hypothetical protein